MSIITNIKDAFARSIEMDKKSPYSVKLYSRIGLAFLLVSFLLSGCAAIGFLVRTEAGIRLWSVFTLPILVFLAGGMYLSAAQRLRGNYFTASFSLVLSALCIIIILVIVVWQAIKLGEVHLPFLLFVV